MYLQHRSTIIQPDGLIEIEVAIVEPQKRFQIYKYFLSSAYAANKFHSIYRLGRQTHGKALAILNQYKEKIWQDQKSLQMESER